MRKITALKAQKKNKNRVNVYLDGQFAFGLARIVAGWLQVGDELDDAKIRELQAQDASELAYQRALNYLSYRERSSDEIRKKLLKHDHDPEEIEAVLARLRRSSLINDRRFAERWVENRGETSPRGRRVLKFELRKKQIADHIIEETLDEIDEAELALTAARRRLGRYKGMEWQEFRTKLGSFLARRGFGYDIVGPILQKLWAEVDGQKNSHGNEEVLE